MLNPQWSGYLEFKPTQVIAFLNHLPHRTVALFAGNQGGKTGSVAKHYVDRLLGICPVDFKNELMDKVRCMSSSLPESDNPDEEDNTQYIELKKRIPPELIEKDITARQKNLIVRRPVGISSKPTVFEFRSSKQEVQDVGKIQLSSVWHDEETPKLHREECKMRLLAQNGDEIFTLTPINPLTYTYDEIYCFADEIYRTDKVADALGLPKYEKLGTGRDIAVIQLATDDNPALTPETIDRIMEEVPEEEIPLRRYGVFKQISGRIHKTYDPNVCYISIDRYFPDGIPFEWIHGRGIDYHESRTPWAIGWISASPQDEWFMWQEFFPAIDGPYAMTTYDIAMSVARKSDDYYYTINLIDPLANKKQPNSGTSATEDLNRYFAEIRENYGIGTPTFFSGWDTKGTAGRNEIMKRFKNAALCGKPFNNVIRKHGISKRLPTMWILNTCPKTHKMIMNWRYQEHIQGSTKSVNDPKNVPQQKNSHINMVLECLAKDQRMKNAAFIAANPPRQAPRNANAGQRRRAA